MHQPDPNRWEPFNCPKCSVITSAAPMAVELTCRGCGHTWKIRTLSYLEAAQHVIVGYKVQSGFESLEKVGRDTWIFTGEDHIESVHNNHEAADILENTFPGSPAGLVKEN
jgi:hypothetical protein